MTLLYGLTLLLNTYSPSIAADYVVKGRQSTRQHSTANLSSRSTDDGTSPGNISDVNGENNFKKGPDMPSS